MIDLSVPNVHEKMLQKISVITEIVGRHQDAFSEVEVTVLLRALDELHDFHLHQQYFATSCSPRQALES